MMEMSEKVCPIVYRRIDGILQVLAFRHPLAGCQLIKGTIKKGESPVKAASRELREESGITTTVTPRSLGNVLVGKPPIKWHLYACEIEDLPRTWEYQTEDDFGHTFSFFWHSLLEQLDCDWHSMFHEAFHAVQAGLLDDLS